MGGASTEYLAARVLRNGTVLVFLSDVADAANPSAGIIVVDSDAFARTPSLAGKRRRLVKCYKLMEALQMLAF